METETQTPEVESPQIQQVEVSPQLMQMSQITAALWLSQAEGEMEQFREIAGPEMKTLHSRMRLMTDPAGQQECARRMEEIGSYGRFLGHQMHLLRLFAGLRNQPPEELTEQDS